MSILDKIQELIIGDPMRGRGVGTRPKQVAERLMAEGYRWSGKGGDQQLVPSQQYGIPNILKTPGPAPQRSKRVRPIPNARLPEGPEMPTLIPKAYNQAQRQLPGSGYIPTPDYFQPFPAPTPGLPHPYRRLKQPLPIYLEA